MDRQCNRCGETKPIEQFHKHPQGLDGYLRQCIECKKMYRRTHRAEHDRRVTIEKNKLKSVPCADCGNTFPPWCMQFYGTFKFDIGTSKSNKRMREIATKCTVLCGNCLSIRANAGKSKVSRTPLVRRYTEVYKTKHPCSNCGVFYPFACMTFHHKDPATKLKDISLITNMHDLLIEIEKCDLLCTNCHLDKEWNENGPSRQRDRHILKPEDVIQGPFPWTPRISQLERDNNSL